MFRQVSWLMGLQKRATENIAICCLDLLYRSCLQPSRRSGQWLDWQATSQLQWRDRAGFSPDFPDALRIRKNSASSITTENDCQDSEHIRVTYARAKAWFLVWSKGRPQ